MDTVISYDLFNKNRINRIKGPFATIKVSSARILYCFLLNLRTLKRKQMKKVYSIKTSLVFTYLIQVAYGFLGLHVIEEVNP